MNITPIRSSRRELALILIYTLALVYGASWLASYDDRSNRVSLAALKPIVDWLLPWGRLIEDNAHVLLKYGKIFLACFGAFLATWTLIGRSRITSERTIFVLATLLAVYAQISLGLRDTTVGIACYCGCVGLMLIYCLIRKTSFSLSEFERPAVSKRELLFFVAIFNLALLLRFYALNYLFDYLEGEEAPFSMAVSDFHSAMLANMGDGGPWSPFGLIYFALRSVPVNLLGATILSLRLTSAVPAMIIFTLIYLCLRDIAGRGAAIAAIVLLTIDAKQISWARFEFPHIATSLTAVLVVWLTYRTFAYRTLIYPIFLSLVMGLCFHQYPSGQTAVAIPWLYLAYLLIFNRDKPWRFYLVRVGFLVFGTALWYYGSSIAFYLAYHRWSAPSLTGHYDGRVGWKSVDGSQSILVSATRMLDLIKRNSWELFGSMIYTLQLGMPPQDMIPTFSHVTSRTIFLLAPAFACAAIFYLLRNLRWKEGALLVCWIIAGSAPCLLSNQGYPRRAATIFPAFICLAGIGYWLCRRMLTDVWGKPWKIAAPLIEVPIALCLILASMHQWFSMRSMRIAEPGDIAVIRAIKERLAPKTLVFFDYDHHYMPGRMTYLLLDELDKPENQPITWTIVNPNHPIFRPTTQDPRSAPKLVSQSIQYRWTKLHHRLPEIENFTDWKKLIFISEHMPSTKDLTGFDDRISAITGYCTNHREIVIPPRPAFYHNFRIIECDLPPAAEAPNTPS